MNRRPYETPGVRTYRNALSAEKQKQLLWLSDTERLTPAVIAERLGVHRNTVLKWLRRLARLEVRSCSCGRRLRKEGKRCYVCRGYRERSRGRDETWRQGTAEDIVRRWMDHGDDGLSREQVLRVLKGECN